jgi:AbrB family looped-hinge helix DNA binding protein
MYFLYCNTEEECMKLSDRGQVTIPKKLRDRYGLTKNTEVEIILTEEGILIRKRSLSRHPVDEVMGILKNESSSDAYIDEIRGR